MTKKVEIKKTCLDCSKKDVCKYCHHADSGCLYNLRILAKGEDLKTPLGIIINCPYYKLEDPNDK